MRPNTWRNLLGGALIASLPLGAAAAAALPSGGAAPDPALSGKKLLFVVKPNTKATLNDEFIRKHVESLGFAVTTADQGDAATKMEGQDLVLISSSVDPDAMVEPYRLASVPLVAGAAEVLPELAMTGNTGDVDFGAFNKKDHYLYVVNATHAIAAGIPAGTFVSAGKSVQMEWGKPALSASLIVTSPGYPDKPVIFAYEKGATMKADLSAPARRVGFLALADFDKAKPETVAMFDAALRWAAQPASAVAETNVIAKGKKLLLVTQKSSPHPKAEVREAVARSNAAMQQHFESLGFVVTVADQSEPVTKAAGQDVVVISAAVQANELMGRYKDVALPIVNLENDVLDDMGMTGKRRGVDFGDAGELSMVTIVDAPHPLAARLKPGKQEMFTEDAGIAFGLPGPGAITIATLPGDGSKAEIFAYEGGATMDHELIAPARRVFLPIDYNAYDKLSDTGVKLVDAALLWVLDRPGT